MTNRSTKPPTALSTARSQPLTLVTWTLEGSGDDYRLKVTGGPLRGVCEVHSWRLSSAMLGAALLAEIEATGAALASSALLSAIGCQLQLALELQEAAGTYREHTGPY